MAEQPTPQDGGSGAPASAEPLIMGKYKSQEDLIEAKRASDTEAQKLNARLQATEARARSAEQLLEGFRPAQTDPVDAIRERMSEGSATPEDYMFLASQAAERTYQTNMRPLMNAASAQSALDPTLLPEAQQLLAADPTLTEKYHRIVNADPEAAASFLEARVKLHRAEAGMHSDADAVEAAKAIARKNATIVRGTGSAPVASSTDTEKEQAARRSSLIDAARNTKDLKTFSKAFLSGIDVWDPGDKAPRTLD